MNRGTQLTILLLAVPLIFSGTSSLAVAQMPTGRPGHAFLATPSQPVSATLALQILLDRAGFSPGEIDGNAGANTRRAAEAFRRAHRLAAGNRAAFERALGLPGTDLLADRVISAEDAAGPFMPDMPSDVMAQAALPALSYTSVLELVAERTHASPGLLRQLNPSAAFAAGETVRVPNVTRHSPAASAEAEKTESNAGAARLVVSRRGSGLTAYDAKGHVIFFAPVTSGSQHDPLPLGKWTVTAVVRNPPFQYNPALFWDAEPSHSKATLPPGPNGPVGTVWIDISKPHYGIHGTPEPGQIGHTASHGCVRLTNWDAETLAGLVHKGSVVTFER